MKAMLEILALAENDIVTTSTACLGKCGTSDNLIGGGCDNEDDTCE